MQAALALEQMCLISIWTERMHSEYHGFTHNRCFDRDRTPTRLGSSEIQAAATQRPNTSAPAAGTKELNKMSLIVGLLNSMSPVLLGVAAQLLITWYVSSYISMSRHQPSQSNRAHSPKCRNVKQKIVWWRDRQHGEYGIASHRPADLQLSAEKNCGPGIDCLALIGRCILIRSRPIR